MLEALRKRHKDESGFTLVELLVVMLILGILAAIAIPSFFNQRDKARDADAKSAARTAQTAMETYSTDNNGSYTGATAAALKTIEPTLNDANLSEPTVTSNSYTVEVLSDVAGQKFRISRSSGGQTTLTCDVAGKGGCPTGGNWG